MKGLETQPWNLIVVNTIWPTGRQARKIKIIINQHASKLSFPAHVNETLSQKNRKFFIAPTVSERFETTFLLEDFESSKFLSLIGEDTNWFFPIGYSKSSMWKVVWAISVSLLARLHEYSEQNSFPAFFNHADFKNLIWGSGNRPITSKWMAHKPSLISKNWINCVILLDRIF